MCLHTQWLPHDLMFIAHTKCIRWFAHLFKNIRADCSHPHWFKIIQLSMNSYTYQKNSLTLFSTKFFHLFRAYECFLFFLNANQTQQFNTRTGNSTNCWETNLARAEYSKCLKIHLTEYIIRIVRNGFEFHVRSLVNCCPIWNQIHHFIWIPYFPDGKQVIKIKLIRYLTLPIKCMLLCNL